ncbi:PREDICTED: glutathione S-transferase Mu 1-like [Chrysochloris asiatica]|uniref:glutathione transferase n=1 Tax=Chrysochloris asiatica TaxID=185453 RepID=A0A9B0TSC6_CHRAS|nr:PREDICTED: glutathione S-transferase Mu 1-like [Chrysochloris asiatica]
MTMILGYWDIRGLAHAIRLLLEYTDSNYEEKKYTMGDAPDFDRSQWLNEKFKLGFDFPNLPYLIDGAHKITQSNAILRYIARKHNMSGETEEEKIRVDIMENQCMDTCMELARVCYSPDFVSSQWAGGLGPWRPGYAVGWALGSLDLGGDRAVGRLGRAAGRRFGPWLGLGLCDQPGLKKISVYMKSSNFLPHPLFGKEALWGNK